MHIVKIILFYYNDICIVMETVVINMRKSMKYKFARNMLLIILLIIVVLMILCNMYNILYIINFFDLKRFLTDNHFFITIIVFLLIMLLVLHLYSTKELDETDFKKNKNYYRDIINNYSISVLNYIDNFTLNYKQAYTAKLLELQKKGIIKIENNIITIINKPTKKIDIYFVESIKNNKVTLSLEIYELLVIDEAVEKDLIVKNNKGLTGFNIFIIMLISMIVAFILFFCCRMFLAPILWMFFVFVLYSIVKPSVFIKLLCNKIVFFV